MSKIQCSIVFFLFFLSFSITAQDFKFGKVSIEELEEKMYQGDSSAVASVLYRKNNLTFDYTQGIGFKVVTSVYERIKIYTKEGFDYATVTESLYKTSSEKEMMMGLKAYTYNLENGEIVKYKLEKSGVFSTERNKYYDEERFTLPNVKEGSVIEYEYRLESPFYYSIAEIPLQYDIPIKQQEVSIATPEYFVFKPLVKGYLPLNPSYGTTSGRITLSTKSRSSGTGFSSSRTSFSNDQIDYLISTTSYTMKNVPALKEEPYVNDMDNYRSAVNYELEYVKFPQSTVESYTTTWEKVIKTIYDSSGFGDQLTPSKYYQDDLAMLLSSAKTESEKVASIFQHVQQHMHWNDYLGYATDKGVKNAYEEKTGNIADINLILTSMLKSANLKANPVLISTRDHGVPMFPTMEGFNYVIAAVELEGNIVLLDASNKYGLPNILPIRALNWFGKLVREDGTFTTVTLMPGNLSKETVNVSAVLDENGRVSGKLRKIYEDHNAYIFRNNYANVNEDDYLEKLENKNEGMEISDYHIKNKVELGKPITEDYSFLLENQANIIGDNIYFSPLFHLKMTENPFKLEERQYPIDFVYPREDKYFLNITIPEGYEVISKPEELNMAMLDNLTGFVYRITIQGQQLQVMASFKINQAIIAADQYAQLKEFFKNALEKQTEKVVLSKIGNDGTKNSSGKGR